MKKIISTKHITPKTALEILRDSNYDFQRPLRQSQVNFLAKEMKEGNFLGNTIVLCKNGSGKKYLVNGQHTLHAIVASETSLDLTVEVVTVENEDEIPAIYSRLDKNLKRTVADSFRVYELEEEFGMSKTDINRYGPAVRFLLNGFKKRSGNETISDLDIIEKMRECLPHTKKYMSLIGSSDISGSLKRMEIFSVGIVTCQYSKMADDFWKYVASDDGLRINDPRKTFRKWVSMVNVHGGGGYAREKVVSVGESVRCVALVWNAYVEGKELKILRIFNKSLPFTLKDTPFKDVG